MSRLQYRFGTGVLRVAASRWRTSSVLWTIVDQVKRAEAAVASRSRCASSKLLRPRNQGLTLRLNSGPKTAKLRRYAQRCCLPRLTWRPCHSGDVSAPRRPGVGERRFAAASDGAEERAPTPTARRHGTGFLGCSSRFVARVGEPPSHRPRGHRGPLASRPIPTVLGKDLAAPPSRSASD